MIKVAELRKGNLLVLTVNFKDVIHRVDEIYTDEVKVTSIEDNSCFPRMNLRTCKPIPITVDLMAKCGFGWNSEEQVYFLQVGNTVYLEFDVDFNCSIVPETWRGQPLHLWGDNKYLHQLQNLYLDLTGNELEIKL
jgi:hypothetical protein